jgi:uncharacterized protein YjdB
MKKLLVRLVAAGATIAGCSSESTTTPPVVASVEVRPGTDSAQVLDTTMLIPRLAHYAAVLKDAGGHVLSIIQIGQSVVWTSSAPTVATVGPDGVATGVAPGTATITAAVEGKNATSDVMVIAVSVATVNVTPTPDSVVVGKTVQLKAWPLRANGDTLKAKKTIWASSDTSIAIVSNADSLGVVQGNSATITGVAAGTATITATITGVNGTASMKVKP